MPRCAICQRLLPEQWRPNSGPKRKFCSDLCASTAMSRRYRARARIRASGAAHWVTPDAPCTCQRDYLTVALEDEGWCVGHH